MRNTAVPGGSLSVCTLLLFAACGGSGGRTAPPVQGGGSLEPHAQTLTLEEARFLVRRACWGGDEELVAQVRRDGLDRALDRLLTFETDTPVETAAMLQIPDPEQPRTDELARWWLWLMLRTRQPLQESLAFFWHDHFATSQSALPANALKFFLAHVGLLRRHAAGNFKQLAYELAVDPSMLVWLDGIDSTRQHPNENFAREFWEVFTLGRDNGYTQQDVEEAARAFTGWRLVTDTHSRQVFVLWDAARHDDRQKTVFGRTGNFGYRELVDLTFAERPVAEYVCGRLFARFCYADPEPELVAQLSKLLREANWELKPVLKAILRSQAFFSPRSRAGRARGPVEYLVGFMRTTGFELPMADLYDTLLSLGQVPTLPPSVFGWAEGAAWLGSQAAMARGNAINDALTARDHHDVLGVSPHLLLPDPADRSPGAVVDAIAARLLVAPTPAERDAYVTFLNSEATLAGSELRVTPSPFDASSRRHVDERVRGLVFLLTQHPSFHLR